ncbi:glycine-rich domain-containing protein [Pseudoalteromonas maricaloris]|uniref:glycine-rich domain-containing protein n=1 Tax=Pseudoalteromonas maricaloris TaxID=184924 RepID=UPI003C18236E
MIGFLILVAAFVAFVGVLQYQKVKTTARRRSFIQDYDLTHLRPKLSRHYPELTNEQLTQVELGLKQFFQANLLLEDQSLAMPSRVVDALWHEFILHTQEYHSFCYEAFDRFLHHCPSEAMKGKHKAQLSLRKTWRACCSIERISPRRPAALPILFALDALLNIPNGYYYSATDFREPIAKGDSSTTTYAGHIGCTSMDSGDSSTSSSSSSNSSCSSGSSCGSGCSS